MSQNALVKRIVSSEVAEVSLMRQMNCKNCDNCGVCSQKPTTDLLAMASNTIGAKVGDMVEVESIAGSSIGIAVLVYVLPCVFLILGYFLGQALGFGELGSVAMGGLGIPVGFVPAFLLNRAISRNKKPEFVILTKLGR